MGLALCLRRLGGVAIEYNNSAKVYVPWCRGRFMSYPVGM